MKLYTTLFFFFLHFFAFAQQNTGSITGKVSDEITLQPIPFATVIIPGTKYGAATNETGDFVIGNLPPDSYELRISALGYETKTFTSVVVNNVKPTDLHIKLSETAVELKEVVVKGSYFNKSSLDISGVSTFSNEEIRRSPGGFEDVVRALSILPGVAQADAGRNDLIVRGGAPSENLYLVDGFEIPNINHFGSQGATGGPLSYINLDFVSETAFSAGAFPALYGDKLSSVLRIDLREGREDRIGGKATISATQFGLNVEGPLNKNSNFLFSARRSYLDFIFKAAGFGFVPEYYDLLSKYVYNPDTKQQFGFLFIGAFDNVRYFNNTADQRFKNSQVLGSDQTQYLSGFTYRRLLDNGFYRISLSRNFTDFDTQQRDSLLNPIFTNISREGENKIRVEYVQKIAKSSELNLGLEAKDIKFSADVKIPDFRTSFGEKLPSDGIFTEQRYFKYAANGNISQAFSERFRLNAGVRVDYFDGINNRYYFSPRVALGYNVTADWQLSLSGGMYYQFPSYIWLAYGKGNENLKAIQADQIVLGTEYRFRDDAQLKIEVYYKNYKDYVTSLLRPYLTLANTGAGFAGADDNFSAFGLEPLAGLGSGVTSGVEFSVQKKLSEIPLYGIFSLTLGQAKFIAADGVERDGKYDQQLLMNIAGGYKFSNSFEVSMKFRYSTGAPYTPFNADGSQTVARYNTVRFDANHSLDLRADKRWFFENYTLITYIDIQNVYGRNNQTAIRWNRRENKIDEQNSIGVLPSIGVSLEF